MSKMHDLSEMSDMRLPSPQIPDEWERDLRQRMVNLGAKSVTAYLEQLIARDLGKEPVKKSWGGNRQPEQDDKDEPPKSVTATLAPPEDYGRSIIEDLSKIAEKMPEQKTVDVKAKPTATMTPNEKIAANRAAARLKLDRPSPLNGKPNG
jgi:hypothetical protein